MAVSIAAALLALGVVLVIAPDWPTGGASDRVPGRLHDPWLWQATVRERPVGSANVLFFTDRTRYAESTGVVVGHDSGYRLIPLGIGAAHGRLSPDGRFYLGRDPLRLVDLATGAERPLGTGTERPPGTGTGRLSPLAWSPEGSRLLVSYDHDGVGDYDPDLSVDNEAPDELLILDVATGRSRTLVFGRFLSHAAATWSPDGTRLAVAGPTGTDGRQRLIVVNTASGAQQWRLDLGNRRRLAGRAAWRPDGRIALFSFDGCAGVGCPDQAWRDRRWRIEFLDAGTGQPVGTPIPVPGRPRELLGWRAGDPVLTGIPADDPTGRHTVLITVSSAGDRSVLVETPAGTSGLELPDRLLARSAFGGPDRRPSPFAAATWSYAAVALPVLLVVLALAVRRRRRAGPARAAGHNGTTLGT